MASKVSMATKVPIAKVPMATKVPMASKVPMGSKVPMATKSSTAIKVTLAVLAHVKYGLDNLKFWRKTICSGGKLNVLKSFSFRKNTRK